jgi:hypothetical protein
VEDFGHSGRDMTQVVGIEKPGLTNGIRIKKGETASLGKSGGIA